MDISEARLDGIESQSLADSHVQNKQNSFSIEKISNIFPTLRSRVFLRDRGEATLHGSVSEFLTNLKFSDLFDVPGEYVLMDAEMLSTLDGNKTWLHKLRSHGIPLTCLRNDQGDSVLHLAAAWNHLELVKSIISECSCLIMEPNSKDQLPIHVAARDGHLFVIEALIASVTFFSAILGEEDMEILNPYILKDINGDTPLKLALKGRHTKVALCLLNANRQASFLASKDGLSPLYLAVEAGDVSLVKEMLGNDGPRGINLEGRKYLVHAALKSKNTDMLDVIFNKCRSFVDERDVEGRTCLSYAAFIGYDKGVCNLLNRSTKCVFVSDNDGSYPIHMAVEKGHIKVVKEILNRCPYSMNLPNKKCQNVLHVAADIGRFKILSYLMKCNHTRQHLVSEQDVDGNTPLHLATIKWRPRAVKRLAGATNLMMQNNKGMTALDIVKSNLKPNYIFLERVTLVALVDAHIQNDPKCKHKMKSTRPIKPEKGVDKDYINALLVVAALIATVTFAAAFTIPGSTKEETPNIGMANLASSSSLFGFLLFDAIALQTSLLAIVFLIVAQLGDPALYQSSVLMAMLSLYMAMVFMNIAFLEAMIIIVGYAAWRYLYMFIFIFILAGLMGMVIKITPHIILYTFGGASRIMWPMISLTSSIDDDGKENEQLPAQSL